MLPCWLYTEWTAINNVERGILSETDQSSSDKQVLRWRQKLSIPHMRAFTAEVWLI